jgi:probable HAF family extracellular repeat protein
MSRHLRTRLSIGCAFVVVGLMLLAGSAGAGAPAYTITDLGDFGRFTNEATAINDNGQVAGTAYVTQLSRHAFLWQGGELIDLGTLGGSNSMALAINDAGHVIGSSDTTSGETHAFVWHDGVMVDLGTLGGNYSAASAVNSSDQVVGTSATESGISHAFLWQDGVMTDLGTLGDPGLASTARGISDDGVVAGSSFVDSGQWHAVVWQDGAILDLGRGEAWGVSASGYVVGYLGSSSNFGFVWHDGVTAMLGTLGGRHSYAEVVNDLGQVAGYSYTAAGDQRSFFWDDGVMTDLGALGGNASSVRAINNQGQVVGVADTTIGAYPADAAYAHAFVWSAGAMTDLGTIGGAMSLAYSINDQGVIVGASLGSGGVRAVMWTPVTDTTPPVITVPDDMTVDATSPDGAVVEFTATATDDVDGDVPVGCTPASGSTFVIGDTTVECTATDTAGNSATASFTVHVKGGSEQLDDLAEAVIGVGPGTSLADKVEAAQMALTDGDDTLACEILNAFINQVTAQTGKSISDPATADALIADATRIRAVLGC